MPNSIETSGRIGPFEEDISFGTSLSSSETLTSIVEKVKVRKKEARGGL
jgi:hypothetical protein